MAARAVSPARRRLPFGAALEPVARSRLTKKFLRPGVIQALGDGFAAAKGSDAFPAAEPFQDNADLVLGGMVLARGAANIANQLFGWHTDGWGRGFLALLHSPWGYDEPEILRYSNRQFGPIGADAGQVFGTGIHKSVEKLTEHQIAFVREGFKIKTLA